MVGSGLGCLLMLFSPSFFGIGGTVVLATLIGLLAFLLFSLPNFRLLTSAALAGRIGIIIVPVTLLTGLELKISPYKSLSQVLLHPEALIVSTE